MFNELWICYSVQCYILNGPIFLERSTTEGEKSALCSGQNWSVFDRRARSLTDTNVRLRAIVPINGGFGKVLDPLFLNRRSRSHRKFLQRDYYPRLLTSFGQDINNCYQDIPRP
jgi:hypothetical protein